MNNLDRVRGIVAGHMEKILAQFIGARRIVVIVFDDSLPEEDFLMTNASIAQVKAAIDRAGTREAA